MRLLANENVPRQSVEFLENAGHDVYWLRRQAPGISDETALALAQQENRTVLTLDKDFAALALQLRLPAASGIT
jgi:predicted nuclease of predicted toxin-antitoxin system